MSKYQPALDVLNKYRDELVGELNKCGQAGGTGRASSYAPILVNTQRAIDVIIDMMSEEKAPMTPQERMANARAAKQANK